MIKYENNSRVVCSRFGTKKPVFRAERGTARATMTIPPLLPVLQTKLAIAAKLVTKRTRRTTTGRRAAAAAAVAGLRVYTNNDNNIERVIAHVCNI